MPDLDMNTRSDLDPKSDTKTIPTPNASTYSSSTKSLQLHTYHCTCTKFVFALPVQLNTLPQRRTPGLDRARILRLHDGQMKDMMAVPSSGASEPDPNPKPNPNRWEWCPGLLRGGYGASNGGGGDDDANVTTDDNPRIVIERPDGFETRWPWRCRRCDAVLGYTLRGGSGDNKMLPGTAEAPNNHPPLSPPSKPVLYLLDQGIISSEELRAKTEA